MEKEKRSTNRKEPRITLVKTISNFCGKDKNMILFRKVKGKLHMFVIDSKKEKKIPLKHAPKSYSEHEFENLGAFLYKLNQQQNGKAKL